MLMIYVQPQFVRIYDGGQIICQTNHLSEIPDDIWNRLDNNQQKNILAHFYEILIGL